MGSYKLSQGAQEDLDYLYEDGILRYGLKQADHYYDGLIDRFHFLADNPQIGYNSFDLAPNLQRFPYERHMIFFMSTDTGILIVRVLGDEMDFKRHLT
ncbi:MAG: type II toxin-antitoxin system RelE/ParE family toxin [Pseudomonadota bacterium]